MLANLVLLKNVIARFDNEPPRIDTKLVLVAPGFCTRLALFIIIWGAGLFTFRGINGLPEHDDLFRTGSRKEHDLVWDELSP
jgi:hypothetical protein